MRQTEPAAGPAPAPAVDHTETLFGLTFQALNLMDAGGPAFDPWMINQATYTGEVPDAIAGQALLLKQY